MSTNVRKTMIILASIMVSACAHDNLEREHINDLVFGRSGPASCSRIGMTAFEVNKCTRKEDPENYKKAQKMTTFPVLEVVIIDTK